MRNNRDTKEPTKHRRTRSGCLCCRLRKKKCDGCRPTCIACERNALICSWAASNANPPPSPEQVEPSVAGGNSSPELSAGSLASKHDDDLFSRGTATRKSLALPRSPIGLISKIKPEHEFIYRNYVTRTANTVSTLQNTDNPFIRLLIPIAASDSRILDSVLALSAVHLWKGPQPMAGAEQLMSTYETLAIRGLKYGLTKTISKDGVDMPLIITALLLSLIEAMKGESNHNTTLHLRGSSTLLGQWVSTRQAEKEPELRAFIVELYLYLAISMGIPLGSESHHHIAQDADLLFPYVKTGRHSGPLLGCAHELFELIPQIHTLARTCSEQAIGITPSSQTGHTYQQLVDKLFAWKPPRDAEHDFVSSARVYQQALLVFLLMSIQRFIDQSINTSDIIEQALGAAVEELRALSLDAPISTTLTWPLAVLGSSSNVPEHQEVVRTRLQYLYQNLHWAVFDQVLCILEVLWEDYSIPRGMEGFEIVMNRLKMHVLIS